MHTVKWFQVLLCITNNSIKYQSFVYTQLNDQTVLFQPIQFSISTQFSSIWPVDRTLWSANTPGKSGTGSDGNKGVFSIPRSCSITRASPSDCFCVISSILIGEVLPLCRDAVGLFYSPWWLGQNILGVYLLEMLYNSDDPYFLE